MKNKFRLKISILSLCLAVLGCSSPSNEKGLSLTKEVSGENDVVEYGDTYVQRLDTLGLTVLYPKYSTINLVCGTMPSKNDSNVILIAEAAYTGELLTEFKHTNIAGDHVSSGKRYKGYRCKRNTGAFVYYNSKWRFCHREYSKDMDDAAANNGCAFGQELIIYNGDEVKSKRKDGNVNQFRALCSHHDALCIIESSDVISFGDFRKRLLEYGVYDAIYLDMGSGWNHSWYRDGRKVIELHPKTHNYCTNWITFYR